MVFYRTIDLDSFRFESQNYMRWFDYTTSTSIWHDKLPGGQELVYNVNYCNVVDQFKHDVLSHASMCIYKK